MYNVHTCTVIKADLKLEWVDSRPIVELEADRPLNKWNLVKIRDQSISEQVKFVKKFDISRPLNKLNLVKNRDLSTSEQVKFVKN